MAKILVYTPTFSQTIQSCVNRNHKHCMAFWARSDHAIIWAGMGRVYLPMARSWACEYALANAFDYIFWLDDDALIDPDYLYRMLAHQVDYVAAPYPMRPATELTIDCATMTVYPQVPIRTGVRTLRPDPTGKEINETLGLDELNQGLIEVAGSGFHCTLMHTRCLTTAPDGSTTLHQEATSGYPTGTGENQRIPYIYFPYIGGEDLCLCTRLRQKGFRLHCDTDLWADHVVGTAILRRPGVGTAQVEADCAESGRPTG